MYVCMYLIHFFWRRQLVTVVAIHSDPDSCFAKTSRIKSGTQDQGCQMVPVFSNPKSRFGLILESLATEDVAIFYGHLVYFTSYWYILRPIRRFCGHLVYFSRFGMAYQENSGNPAQDPWRRFIFKPMSWPWFDLATQEFQCPQVDGETTTWATPPDQG
jgi:hypothetical protein